MSFFSPPKVPNAGDVSNTQLGYNMSAAKNQQQINMVNQQTPFGSLQYTPDSNAPGGYSANVSLSTPQQAILDQLQGVQQQRGQAAGNEAGALTSLTSNFGSLYGQPPNIDPSTLTNKMMGWGHDYMQPIFDMQQSNLDAKLRNQGITPGSEAWNNAQNLQSRNVNNAYTNLMLQAEPTAFSQAMQEYQLPYQAAYGLQGLASGAPGPQNQTFQNTPQEQIQPPNYQTAAQNQFQGQQTQYQNLMSGIGQLAGVAAAPFTGGMSMMPGMFAGGWGG